MPTVRRELEESSSEDEEKHDHLCIAWTGISRKIPVLIFHAETIITKDAAIRNIGEHYHLAYKIVRTESRLVRNIMNAHGFHEVHPNSNDFNLMWTGCHPKPFALRSFSEFQKVNHFPRSYELTRKDRLYKNIQRMQQSHGFRNFNIAPQTFILPSEYQEFCSAYSKDKGPWIVKPVASSRGRGVYLVSNPNHIPLDESILVSRYISNPLLIDDFKFDVRLYVLVTSYDPVIIYLYEEGLARFATVKYDRSAKNIKNQFMHLTNYSVNKKSSDYVSCDDPEVEDYGNKWSMSAVLRYLKQEGKNTTALMAQIEDLIIKTVLSAELQIATACKTFVPHRGNCFELYGFDVLIDANWKPWLLEVNLSPSLACDSPLDLKVKASMISDMFSIVGFACQDPVQKQNQVVKSALESPVRGSSWKHQRPFSAQSQPVISKMHQRPMSASDADPAAAKEKVSDKTVGGGTLGLSMEEIKVLRRTKEEYERRGGFIRIFPTEESWELYGSFLEYKTQMNYMLALRLFPDRVVKQNMSVKVRTTTNGNSDTCQKMKQHAMQYERKLLSLEMRKRRQQLRQRRSAATKHAVTAHKLGRPDAPPRHSQVHSETKEEEEEEEEEISEPEEMMPEKDDHCLRPVSERDHNKSQKLNNPFSEHTKIEIETPGNVEKMEPKKVNLLQRLEQGGTLSKVQARMAFSAYLEKVQTRLKTEIVEHDQNTAWVSKEDEQMELVIRFLKKAAVNLQRTLNLVLPSRHIPLADRRKILAKQLGEFIHVYNMETDQMVIRKQHEKFVKEKCISVEEFQAFVATASENDLEEVLTFYTHTNKSASVFLGTGSKDNRVNESRTVKQVVVEVQKEKENEVEVKQKQDASVPDTGTNDQEENNPLISVAVAKGAGRVADDATVLKPSSVSCSNLKLRSVVQRCASDQHCPSHPPALDSTQARIHRPPQHPTETGPSNSSLMQTSLFSASYSSTTLGRTAPLNVNRTHTSALQSFHPVHPEGQQQQKLSSSSCYGNGHFMSTSSIQSAIQIYSQKLSRPASAKTGIHQTVPSRQRPSSAVTAKDGNSHVPQHWDTNQEAIAASLQRLAEKQSSRQYSMSSHISILTQHLASINLTNGALNRGSTLLNHSYHQTVPSTVPAGAFQSEAQVLESALARTRVRSLERSHLAWERETDNAYSCVTGVAPQQKYQPTAESCQFQYAVQKFWQGNQQFQQLLDQSQAWQQVVSSEHPTLALGQKDAPASINNQWKETTPSASLVVAGHSKLMPYQNSVHIVPKPPVNNKQALSRKTATHRLSRPSEALWKVNSRYGLNEAS
ncbi:tubulin polyglutamylase TTLL5 [Protopterus annectens]|uniref:tubulin polyglutamylase TTLL5 n=1 Tax=Protopterus annectens TaxID=7888 RepID=UPI001CFB5D36|nr:tubulin polyglutamylase TTLL5 [Protopterus annectens]